MDKRLSETIEQEITQSKPANRGRSQLKHKLPQKRLERKASQQKRVVVPSLIKWTGSKRSQAEVIYETVPPHNAYFEPFLGGGSLLYLAAKPGAVGSDIYAPLVRLWRLVQANPASVAESYRSHWEALQKNLPNYFYEVRKRFNQSQDPLDLCFLTRTCVNGIIRFNDRGEFNNSFHLSRRGMRPDRFASIVKEWAARIQSVTFVACDYAESLAKASRGDFVYMDPPYAGNKQRYAENLDLKRFFEMLEKLNRRGVLWALSFDGRRGNTDLSHPVPKDLYKRRLLISSGNSAVGKVLNRSIEYVCESLYVNY